MGPRWYLVLSSKTRRVFWTQFSGFGVDALNVQLYPFVLPALLTLWGLSHAQAGLLGAATLASSAVGGWIAGLLADRFGRVRVLKVTIVWLAISTGLCAFAGNFHQLLIARLFQGVGFGGEWAVGAVFIAEVAPSEIRGRMVGMAQSAWAVGWGSAAITSAIALSLLSPDLGWRVTFAAGFLPAILVFVFRIGLKDSDVFLKSSRQSPWHAIFSRPTLSSTIRGSLLATGAHGGYWAIATWWPAILQSERGYSATASGVYFAAVIVGSFFGYLCGSWLSDSVGRRVTLAGFALGGIFVVLACTEFQLSEMLLLSLSFPLGFFALGMYSVVGPVLTELYPTDLRGSGVGFCFNFGRGIGGATPLLIGLSVKAFGISQATGLYVACAYGLVLLATALLPETRSRVLKSLAETGENASRKLPG